MGTYFLSTFKKYYTSKTFYLTLLFSFFLLISAGSVLPSGMVVPAVITFSTVIIIMVMFGGSLIEMRKTSMIKSLSLTKISKTKYFVVNISVSMIFAFISVFVILFFTWFLTDVNFLVGDLGAWGRPNLVSIVAWKKVDWWSLVYGIIVTSALSFTLAFLIISFTKSSYNLYLFVFIYSFFLFTLGDLIIPKFVYENSDHLVMNKFYWFLPHYYTNKIIAGSLATTNLLPDMIANNEEAILHDTRALEAWAGAGFPTTHLGTAIDWTQVPGYRNGYTFEVTYLNDPIIQAAMIRYAINNPQSFTNSVFAIDQILSFGDQYNLWVFGSVSSMMICFFPLIMITSFGLVSVKSFRWTNR